MSTNDELQAQVVSLSNKILEVTVELQVVQEQLRGALREAGSSKTEASDLRSENAVLAQRVQSMEDELADLSSSLVDEANQQVSEANRRVAAAHKLVDERDDVIASQAAELLALKTMLEAAHDNEAPSLAVQRSRPVPGGNNSGSDLINESPMLGNGTRSGDSSSRIASTPRIGSGTAFSSPVPASPLLAAFASPRLPSSGAGSNSLRRILPPVHGEITKDLILDLDAYASPTRPLIRTDLRDYYDFIEAWGSALRDSAKWSIFQLQQEPWRRSGFVQRVIREDIEPTVRVDKAVHLSYLGIRNFLNSILDLSISLTPVSTKELPWSRRPSQPCLICGESRPEEIYERSYWAQVPREAEPIVLDLACVAKTRLACELVGFLRQIAKRGPANDAQKRLAWRQCNSMREQLFWARTGGLFPDSPDALAAVQTFAGEDFDFGVDKEAEDSREDDSREDEEDEEDEESMAGHEDQIGPQSPVISTLASSAASLSTSPKISPRSSPRSSLGASPTASPKSSPSSRMSPSSVTQRISRLGSRLGFQPSSTLGRPQLSLSTHQSPKQSPHQSPYQSPTQSSMQSSTQSPTQSHRKTADPVDHGQRRYFHNNLSVDSEIDLFQEVDELPASTTSTDANTTSNSNTKNNSNDPIATASDRGHVHDDDSERINEEESNRISDAETSFPGGWPR